MRINGFALGFAILSIIDYSYYMFVMNEINHPLEVIDFLILIIALGLTFKNDPAEKRKKLGKEKKHG